MKTMWRYPWLLFVLCLLPLLLGAAWPVAQPAQAADAPPEPAEDSAATPHLYLPFNTWGFTLGAGVVTGRVVDASQSGAPVIPGVTVCIDGLPCAQTDSSGVYRLEGVPAGAYWMSAGRSDYMDARKTVTVLANQDNPANFALSPSLAGTNVLMRIVLTWRPEPNWPPFATENDLDLNLWMEAITPAHIYAGNAETKGDCTVYPNACLESDQRFGSGPETVAVVKMEKGVIYHFGVLNYNAGYEGVPPLTQSQAHLDVYDIDGLLASFDAPVNGSGDLWYAFTMDESKNITTVNCITAYSGEDPPSCSPAAQAQELKLRPPKPDVHLPAP